MGYGSSKRGVGSQLPPAPTEFNPWWLPMPNGRCRPNCCLYGIHLVWRPYKNDRYASKTVRVRDRFTVSVYSLPDDGVQAPY